MVAARSPSRRRRDRERFHLVDDRRDLATGRLELYVDGFSRASSTAVANTSAVFGISPLGLGLLNVAGLQRRHRAHRVLRLSLDPAMVRRWHADPFGFLRPWNELPVLMGSAPPATPPSSGTGVVTFRMG